MAQPVARCLPAGANFLFIGEGAANAVFGISFEEWDTPEKEYCRGKLLRVPKDSQETLSYEEQQQYYDELIRPLLGDENIVSQELVDIAQNNSRKALNEVLARWEARKTARIQRRSDFVGSRIANVPFGMLVEDMGIRGVYGMVLDLKPKWLARSPNISFTKAKRCRNCARNAEIAVKTGKPLVNSCSFDFLNAAGDDESAARIWEYADKDDGDRNSEELVQACRAKFLEWLKSTDLFEKLAKAQQDNDQNGVLKASLDDQETIDKLQVAMTLRDCSCYVKVPGVKDQPVVAKLGDLDKKNSKAKLEYWKRTETNLIQGGFYEGTEDPRQETSCQMST